MHETLKEKDKEKREGKQRKLFGFLFKYDVTNRKKKNYPKKNYLGYQFIILILALSP